MQEEDTPELVNDYGRIADRLESILMGLLGGFRDTPDVLRGGDCRVIRTDDVLDAIVETRRLHLWVEGLAESYRTQKG